MLKKLLVGRIKNQYFRSGGYKIMTSEVIKISMEHRKKLFPIEPPTFYT